MKHLSYGFDLQMSYLVSNVLPFPGKLSHCRISTESHRLLLRGTL